MRTIAIRSIVLYSLLAPIVALAQDKLAQPSQPVPASKAAPGHYKLVYRLLQLGEDNKVEKSRTYSTIVTSDDPDPTPAQIRNGDRVPVFTDSNFTQYTYQDVGTNIDTFRPTVHGRDLALQVSADLTTVVKAEGSDSKRPPVIRHISWRSNVIVAVAKPTIIFTSDNVSDTGKTELELTATPVREP